MAKSSRNMTHGDLSYAKKRRGRVPGYQDMKPTHHVEPFLTRIHSKQTLNSDNVDEKVLQNQEVSEPEESDLDVHNMGSGTTVDPV